MAVTLLLGYCSRPRAMREENVEHASRVFEAFNRTFTEGTDDLQEMSLQEMSMLDETPGPIGGPNLQATLADSTHPDPLESRFAADARGDGGHIWLPLRVSDDRSGAAIVDELISEIEEIRAVAASSGSP